METGYYLISRDDANQTLFYLQTSNGYVLSGKGTFFESFDSIPDYPRELFFVAECIDLSKRYKTKNGLFVSGLGYCQNRSHVSGYSLAGVIHFQIGSAGATWEYDGTYSHNNSTGFDLVEDVSFIDRLKSFIYGKRKSNL